MAVLKTSNIHLAVSSKAVPLFFPYVVMVLRPSLGPAYTGTLSNRKVARQAVELEEAVRKHLVVTLILSPNFMQRSKVFQLHDAT